MRSQGAEVTAAGVQYRTWCEHKRATVLLVRPDGTTLRKIALVAENDGYFGGLDPKGQAGDLYRYQFDDDQSWPDPASRSQPFGVHGPSMVIDPNRFEWSAAPRPKHSLGELVIYEAHLGAFTAEGTFLAAIEKLDHLVRLGVNAIELMPVADFPGARNWGYDGVCLYAPARAYGTPDDLRALVDAAHTRGLSVILDVVYNHFGPDGNYIGCFHRDYWNPRHKTPWGAGLNYEHLAVRDFIVENPEYWMREFRIDGFRLDATHEIKDDSKKHILAEIAERIHSLGGLVVAEDDRNEPKLICPGGLGLDGVWADDFHHVVRVALTGERESYYENFTGSAEELAQTLARGWLFRGQKQSATGRARGGDPAGAKAEQFIFCISNHDQAGNRALGERLGHSISAAAYRAASALLCLVPQTPMLFMGQEWNASSPFQFFTDHEENLGRKITEGRRREFKNFAAFRDPATRETIPDPQAESTFLNSKLQWDELERAPHAGLFALYRECLELRRRIVSPNEWSVERLADDTVMIVYREFVLVTDLIGGHERPAKMPKGREIFSSNSSSDFSEPITLVLEKTTGRL